MLESRTQSKIYGLFKQFKAKAIYNWTQVYSQAVEG